MRRPSRRSSSERRIRLDWTFRGQAIDETGKPIEGACISFGSNETLSSQGVLDDPLLRTDERGRFEFAWSPLTQMPGSAYSSALIIAPGRASAFLNPGILAILSRSQPGPHSFDLGVVTLLPAVTLAGRIHRENGHPLAGAQVVATDAVLSLARGSTGAMTNAFYTSVATSDERGAFTLPGCMASGAELAITCDGYFAREIALATPRDPLLIEMQESGLVEGRVLGADGKPCAARS